jgi:broad specificity phosphatase PhoE
MTQLWLIRHGQTDWNLEKRYQGHTDIPLNATGRAQAYELAASLSGQHFDTIYSSDLQRAYQTAEILAQALGLSMHAHPGLREACHGEWEGKTVDEVRRQYEIAFIKELDPLNTRAPGGESARTVADRMAAAADEIARAYPDGMVLVVSHGFSSATLICQARGFDLKDVYQYIPDNAHPEIIEWG